MDSSTNSQVNIDLLAELSGLSKEVLIEELQLSQGTSLDELRLRLFDYLNEIMCDPSQNSLIQPQ